MRLSIRRYLLVAAAVVTVGFASSAAAKPQASPETPGARVTVPSAQTPMGGRTVVVSEAQETRRELRTILDRHSPSLGRVLRLDPSLLGNATYLAPYPDLAAFLTDHPEVARDPEYFLAGVTIPGRSDYERPNETIMMWRNMMEGVTIFTVFVVVTAALIWLVKTLVDYRRWHRLSKVQAEVHNKLLDRFASNEELLAYVQTPAGSRFLESAPISLDVSPSSYNAPVRRILWAVEAGLVVAAGGCGLLFVSRTVLPEVAQALYAMGVFALSIGAGFVFASVVSFVLSKRLGLFVSPAAPGARPGTPALE